MKCGQDARALKREDLIRKCGSVTPNELGGNKSLRDNVP